MNRGAVSLACAVAAKATTSCGRRLRRRATVLSMSGVPGSRAGLCAAVLAALVAIAAHAVPAPELLLWVAPLLLLLVPLIAGRFPGEAAIHAHRRVGPKPPRRRDARPIVVRHPEPRSRGHRGRLLAFRLAERGPPAAILAA